LGVVGNVDHLKGITQASEEAFAEPATPRAAADVDNDLLLVGDHAFPTYFDPVRIIYSTQGNSRMRGSSVLGSSETLGLAQEAARIVSVSPMLHDLAVRYAEHVDGLDLHLLACGSNALELSPVGAAHDDSGSHPIPFCHHVLDGDAEIGEALSGLGEGLLEGVDELSGRVV
jgi:hypothetical protein